MGALGARKAWVIAVACSLAALVGSANAGAETIALTPGPEQTFVVPSGVTHLKVTAIGEKGQDLCLFGTCFSGFGEKVTATLPVTPGQRIYADFVGGGAASGAGGRGGNAADLRTVPSGQPGSLESRLVVAGGGGGEGELEEGASSGKGGNAGAGQGEAGSPSSPFAGAGGGGTQKGGGIGGTPAGAGSAGEAGQLGRGGKGGTGTPAGNAGGGGGGYYGGGGGGGGEFAGAGGGGGSSFLVAGAEESSFSVNSAEAPTGITITYAGGTETVTYDASGSEQSFVVPVGVASIKVIATGANGSDACGCGAGLGEKVTASLPVKQGQTFYVDFGGGGLSSEGGSGGDAADLRTVPRAQAGSLASRLIVAGGGGGSGISEEGSIGGAGGNAGFDEGAGGNSAFAGAGGGGGTQKNGGAGGKGEANGEAGQLGQGGKPGDGENVGGGGGGGYYGGGGGASGVGGAAGGGGGSSFAAAGTEDVSSGLNAPKQPAAVAILYRSAAPPSVSITTPADGSSYSQGQSVSAAFICTEGAEGPGLKPGGEGCAGTVANGAAVDTSTPGKHTFTVTAKSQDGLEASKTVSYTVAEAPSVSITTPAEAASYAQGQTVGASYSCSEGAGGPGLKPGGEGCAGTVANGAAVDTSTPGKHTFTVTAKSQDGLEASKTVSYTVAEAPSVSITTPAEAASYAQGQTVGASYSCSEGAGGPGLKPGGEGCAGTVANGAAVDTSTPGKHTFTVTAKSQDGLEASKTVSYTVAEAPSVSITTPAEAASYAQGQTVGASYSCSEGAGGPGLKPGGEGCAGTVANGAAVDTSTPGKHTFTVTAKSQDGLEASKTVSYTVAEAQVCTMASGRGTYGKSGEPGHLGMGDSLSTNLAAPQRLWVNHDAKKPRFHLLKLLAATCTGAPGARVFEGRGTAISASKRGYTLSFSIYEAPGGFFLAATLAKGAEETKVAAGPLKTRDQKIE